MRPRVLACRRCLGLSIGQVDDACPCGRGLLVEPDAHYYAALSRRDVARVGAHDLPLALIAGVGAIVGAIVTWLTHVKSRAM